MLLLLLLLGSILLDVPHTASSATVGIVSGLSLSIGEAAVAVDSISVYVVVCWLVNMLTLWCAALPSARCDRGRGLGAVLGGGGVGGGGLGMRQGVGVSAGVGVGAGLGAGELHCVLGLLVVGRDWDVILACIVPEAYLVPCLCVRWMAPAHVATMLVAGMSVMARVCRRRHQRRCLRV